jgi:hypothetical protein
LGWLSFFMTAISLASSVVVASIAAASGMGEGLRLLL